MCVYDEKYEIKLFHCKLYEINVLFAQNNLLCTD